MNKDKINPKVLSGEDLFHYFTTDHPDEDYRSMIWLLPSAVSTMEEVYQLLDRALKEDRIFVAIYPGVEESPVDTKDLEYIGPIEDGALYLK